MTSSGDLEIGQWEAVGHGLVVLGIVQDRDITAGQTVQQDLEIGSKRVFCGLACSVFLFQVLEVR